MGGNRWLGLARTNDVVLCSLEGNAMTIIAWDGTILAADRQSTHAEMRRDTTKLHWVDGHALAFTGDESAGLMMLEWWAALCTQSPKPWPACQSTPDWARLIVVNNAGVVTWYEQNPVALSCGPGFHAWGSGRDFAIGAMAAGAKAVQAVEVACEYSVFCGGSHVDWIDPRSGRHAIGPT